MLENLGINEEIIKQIEKESKRIDTIYNELEEISDKIAKEYGYEKISRSREVATRYSSDKPFLSYNWLKYWKKPKEVQVSFGARDFSHENPFFEVKAHLLIMELPKRGKYWTPNIIYQVRKDVESSVDSIFKTIDDRLETIAFKVHFRGAGIPDVQKSQAIPLMRTLTQGALRGKDIK